MGMLSVVPIVVGLAAAQALMSLGGGAYEVLVVDAAWPARPNLIQPQHGGLLRRRFWMPMHGLFELTLLTALVMAWSTPAVRVPLLYGFGAHAVMRVWSFAYFIPKAMAFESDGPSHPGAAAARAWVQRSRLRLPLDLVTIACVVTAFVVALRGQA